MSKPVVTCILSFSSALNDPNAPGAAFCVRKVSMMIWIWLVCAVGEAAAGGRGGCSEGVHLCTQAGGQQPAPPGWLRAYSGPPRGAAAA